MAVGAALPVHVHAGFDAALRGRLRERLTSARVAFRRGQGAGVRVDIHATFNNGDEFQATGEEAQAHGAFDAALTRLEKQSRRLSRARRTSRRDVPDPPE